MKITAGLIEQILNIIKEIWVNGISCTRRSEALFYSNFDSVLIQGTAILSSMQ